ncbi:unnamed protein product [Rhizophagus irregularis]|nr:unnamed protein product [Rhizophagus irregularis]
MTLFDSQILIQTNHYSITLVIILIFQKLLSKMGRTMIDEVINSQKYKEKYEILEKEIYKLFVKNCKNITEFYWQTTLPLCQCPGASTFFSQLHTLKIDYLIPIKLFEMAEYCQNTKNLGIWNCDDIPGLIKFVDN